MNVLALETATEACSAAVSRGSHLVLRHEVLERGHAARILSMVDEVLREAGLRLSDLDAIAFGRGPGAFTGVRLAASVCQGLAYGAHKPIVAVSTLQAMAHEALERHPQATHVQVCNDARMKEVYFGSFTRGAEGLVVPAGPERVGPPQSAAPELGAERMGLWVAVGRGLAAYPALAESWTAVGALLEPERLPSAQAVLRLALPRVARGDVLPPVAAVPVYVRDNVARPKS